MTPEVKMWVRYGPMMILFLMIVGCQQIPKVDDHFQRESPLETVRYFRYCVDACDLSRAYETLTEDTRQQISSLQFKGLIRFVDVPELDDIGLRDLIVKSKVDPIPEAVNGNPGQWWVTLIWESETQLIEYSLRLVVGPDQLWQLDLLSPRGLDFGSVSP